MDLVQPLAQYSFGDVLWGIFGNLLGLFGFLLGTVFLYAVLPVGLIAGAAYGARHLIRHSDKEAAARKLAAQARAEIQELYRQASVQFTSPDEFVGILAGALVLELERQKIPLPPREIFAELLKAGTEIYKDELPRPAPPALDQISTPEQIRPFAQRAARFDGKILTQAIVASLVAFLKHLPESRQAQFSVPVHQVINERQAIIDVVMPFYHTGTIAEGGLSSFIRYQYHRGAEVAAGRQRSKDLVWPLEYEGDDVVRTYLAQPLANLFRLQVPWGYSDSSRMRHQWVLGTTGSGKTTYLRNLLLHDLERVARDECSVVVMDSQFRLIDSIARLKMFAPGEALCGRLIHISPRDPIALNPFRMVKARDEGSMNAAVELLTYAFGGVLETDLTAHQTGAARYIIRAMLEIPNATLETFTEFLAPNGHLKYQDDLARLTGPAKFYFDNAFPKLRSETKQGIVDRLLYLRDHTAIDRMLCAPDCKLDLAQEFQSGKVILIDTDKKLLSEARTETFGRLFIAMLLQATQARAHEEEGALRPVFCYIDEAHEYIKNDGRVPIIIDQARKQAVALTLAHQRESHIINPAVQAALHDVNIRVRCIGFQAHVKLGPREHPATYDIPIANINFDKMPRMSEGEYQAIRQQMRERYGMTAGAPSAPLVPAEDASSER